MNTETKMENVVKEYLIINAEISERLAQLQNKVETMHNLEDNNINWAYVGDLHRVKSYLDDLIEAI